MWFLAGAVSSVPSPFPAVGRSARLVYLSEYVALRRQGLALNVVPQIYFGNAQVKNFR